MIQNGLKRLSIADDHMSPDTKRFRILSLDGGQRGVLMARMLMRLHERLPGFLDRVDLFAGTSAGAMTAAIALTSPSWKTGLQRAHDFWNDAKFAKINPLQNILSLTGKFPLTSNAAMLEQLEIHLGDITLEKLSRKIVIPAFQLDNGAKDPVFRNWTPRLFHNLPLEGSGSNELLRDVVMRSGSAPIVSPAYQGYVDGGLYANNPSLCALALAKDYTGLPVEQIEIFSVGMGQNPIYLNKSTDNLGYMDWFLDSGHAMAMLNAVAESNLKAISYQCGRLLESGFYRLDPRLPHAFYRKNEKQARSDMTAWERIAAEVNLVSAETWLINHGWQKPVKTKPAAKASSKTKAKPAPQPGRQSKVKSVRRPLASAKSKPKAAKVVKVVAAEVPVTPPEIVAVAPEAPIKE